MTGIPAPFDGVLVKLAERDVAVLCRRFHSLKALGEIAAEVRMVVYTGGYVALEMNAAELRRMLGDGYQWKRTAI